MNTPHIMNELEITKAALAFGWVKFSYTKADGTKRVAIGTTNRALIEQTRGYALPEYRENRHYYDNCGYFDLSRCDWRQFREERFIGLELDRLNNEQAVVEAFAIIGVVDHWDAVCVNKLRSYAVHIIPCEVVAKIETAVHCHVSRGSYTLVSPREDEQIAAVVKVVTSAPIIAAIVKAEPQRVEPQPQPRVEPQQPTKRTRADILAEIAKKSAELAALTAELAATF